MEFENWTLDQWLQSLENRNVQEIQLGLERIKSVAYRLDLLSFSAPIIMLAGTNGKGSTAAALEELYTSSGYVTACYTSPHLIQFNERIRVNQQMISDEDLVAALRTVERARSTTVLTYFEMITLAALLHFKQHKLDVIILEVGLGGRLDAVNIVNADLAIITTIDYDHEEYLGPTLESIAYEKSGILRPNIPVIYADNNIPVTIKEHAIKLNCQLNSLNENYFIQENESTWELLYQSYHLCNLSKSKVQIKSAAAALLSCLILEDKLPVNLDNLLAALSKISISGRLQLETGSIDILFDVSHNPQSVNLLAEYVYRKKKNYSQVHAIFSALKDKNIKEMLLPLKNLVNYWYPAVLNGKRSTSSQQMLSHFTDAGINVQFCFDRPLDAFEMAFKKAKTGDLIIVYGSFLTVSQIMAIEPARRFNETVIE